MICVPFDNIEININSEVDPVQQVDQQIDKDVIEPYRSNTIFMALQKRIEATPMAEDRKRLRRSWDESGRRVIGDLTSLTLLKAE